MTCVEKPDCEFKVPHRHCVWCPTGFVTEQDHWVLWNRSVCVGCAETIKDIVSDYD